MAEEFDDDGLVAPWDKAVPTAFLPDDRLPFSDKAFNLSDYCRDLTMTFYAAFPDVLNDGRNESRIIYYVEEVWDAFLVVQQQGNQEGNGLYRVDYAVTEDDIVFAERGDWQPGRRIFVPVSTGMQTAEKAGRILSQRNADRVLAAIGTLQELLIDAGVLEALAEETENSQEESAGAGPLQAPTPRRADADVSPADLLKEIDTELADIGYALIH
jgi:hypothetical protein